MIYVFLECHRVTILPIKYSPVKQLYVNQIDVIEISSFYILFVTKAVYIYFNLRCLSCMTTFSTLELEKLQFKLFTLICIEYLGERMYDYACFRNLFQFRICLPTPSGTPS